KEILSMPGSYHWSIDMLPAEVREIATLGIPAVILFGLPSVKDEVGSENYDEHGIVQQAIRTIKGAVPDLVVVTDVCMCEYTSHGHCGIVRDGYVQNDETLEYLTKVAYSHAAAGADIVAPSGMIDGQVGAIREALDKNDYENMAIMSYAAKYASSFYGPFRDAALSPPKFGDRRSHQMDPPNAREALREVALDIEEGADIVMIKPALAYLDIIRQVRDHFDYPVAAYSVSGEYSMVKAAAARGWLDERRVAMECLTSIKRAGADMIITYWAKDVAQWLGTK
ncbi:MAG TPA: porphobilinogen synthase, partial [Chromatiales bacterium]|nr:porphobilinogen synthase [Chromatiales bacterium]HEX22248.1 porphobilinogen synthase [Chromatiales bacterium]